MVTRRPEAVDGHLRSIGLKAFPGMALHIYDSHRLKTVKVWPSGSFTKLDRTEDNI